MNLRKDRKGQRIQRHQRDQRDQKAQGAEPTRSLRERIAQLCGYPSDAVGLSFGFTAELRGRNEVRIGGCERIVYYHPDRITMQTRDGEWTVSGQGLTCTAYDCGSLGIEGRIEGVYSEAAVRQIADRLSPKGGAE